MPDISSAYKFTVRGKFPSMNEFIDATRANKYKGAQMKRKWQDITCRAIRQQLPHLHISDKVNLHYVWIEENQRRDKDNVSGFGHKVIQDALVEAKVIDNDGWANIESFSDRFKVQKGRAGVEVYIEVIGGAKSER